MPLVLGSSLSPQQHATIVNTYGEQSREWFRARIFSFSRAGRLLSVIVIDPQSQVERLA